MESDEFHLLEMVLLVCMALASPTAFLCGVGNPVQNAPPLPHGQSVNAGLPSAVVMVSHSTAASLAAEAPPLSAPDCAAVTTSQGDDVFPIPGTKRVKYLEQNVAAYAISKTLSKADLAELEAAVPKHEVKANNDQALS